MTNEGIELRRDGKNYTGEARLETDLAKLPSIIADAHNALLDRIEEESSD